jgi:hypothetical protein
MSRRIFANSNWTTGIGTADNASLVTARYQYLDPNSASQMIMVKEIWCGGGDTVTAPQNMQFRRCSTIGTGTSALASPASDGPLNLLAAAITTAPLAVTAWGTVQPVATNVTTYGRLILAFNSLGGIAKWRCDVDDEWWMIGTGVNIASALANNTGANAVSGTISSSITYELP